MGQSRLNHIMILSIYKEEVEDINLDLLGDEFIRGSEHRLHYSLVRTEYLHCACNTVHLYLLRN